jgi:hypothetical protein
VSDFPPSWYGVPDEVVAALRRKANRALAMGILSALGCVPLGIVAIVWGNDVKRQRARLDLAPSVRAQGAFILGIIGLALWALFLVIQLLGGGGTRA